MIILAAAIASASLAVPVKPIVTLPSWRDGSVLHMAERGDKNIGKDRGKPPRKFQEIVQGVQYDGDYSPEASREPDPEPDAVTPVRFVPEWKRQIPVRVKPAPRIVEAGAPQQQNGGQNQQDAGQQTTPGQAFTAEPTAPQTVDPDVVTSNYGSAVGAGSATGSTAVPSYGGQLPTATATTSAPAGSTVIQVTQPR